MKLKRIREVGKGEKDYFDQCTFADNFSVKRIGLSLASWPFRDFCWPSAFMGGSPCLLLPRVLSPAQLLWAGLLLQ